jgi:protein TonB
MTYLLRSPDEFGRQNYGSYALKKVYPWNLSKGLVLAVGFHAVVILAYYFSTLLMAKPIEKPFFDPKNILVDAPPIDINSITKIVNPKQDVSSESLVIPKDPVIVPNTETVPEFTFKNQDELKIYTTPSLGIDNGGAIDVPIDHSLPIEETPIFQPISQPPVEIAPLQLIYPELAKKAGIEGKVFVRALIDESGFVKKVEFISGEIIFKESAVQALYQMRFKPAISGDRAVKAWITYPITFKLR